MKTRDKDTSLTDSSGRLFGKLDPPGELLVHVSPETRPSYDTLLFSEPARDKLMAFREVVDRVVGRGFDLEFACLLLGPREGRVVTDVALLQNQQVTSAGFHALPQAVSSTVRDSLKDHPDLVVLGLVHRHPGFGAWCVKHSSIDEVYIEGELMPMMAANLLRSKTWSRPLVTQPDGEDIVLSLDVWDRRSVRLSLHGDSDEGSPHVSATLEGRDKTADVFSVVFSKDGYVFCRAITYSFNVSLNEDGIPGVSRIETINDVPVRLVPPQPELPVPVLLSDQEMEEEVRRHVRRYVQPVPRTTRRRGKERAETGTDAALLDGFPGEFASYTPWLPELVSPPGARLLLDGTETVSDLLEAIHIAHARIDELEREGQVS